jgi:hypothetical protein
MSIFSAPSFYGAADRAIYDAGNYFIPQEQYRGAFTMQTPPVTGTSGAAAATGINTVLNQGGGGGGGNNPFNPDMNQIRTDFRPDTEFRQFQDFGNLTDAQLTTEQRKEMDMYPEYYGINTGVPRTGIAGFFDKAMGFLPGVGMLSRIAPAIKNFLPVNQRAILENQLRGQGVLTDDIGRIVARPGEYNTPEGIMAGYNANRMTGATFDKRTGNISKTLQDRTSLTKDQIDAIVNEIATTGKYSGDLTDEDLGLKNLFSNLVNVNLAKYNFMNTQKKAAEIAAFKEAQRKAEKAEKERQKAFKDARNARDSDNDGVPDYVEDAGGSYDGYYGSEGGFENTGTTTSSNTSSGGGGGGYDGRGGGRDMGGGSPGSSGPGGSDEMGSFAYGGRVQYMMGGLADLVDIYD